jgi:hypothetical protein
VWGSYNSATLPAYHRLDVRVSREVPTRRGRLFFFIDVYNLYNRENARAVTLSLEDLRNGRPMVREINERLLPRLPAFGVQWEF